MDKIEDNGPVISGGTTPEPNVETSREAVTFGDYLDWESPLVPVSLLVELPFWLMIDDCELDIPLGPSQVRVTIHSQHREVYMGEVTDSRRTLVYRGPDPDRMNPEILQIAEENGLGLMERPSRTVLRLRAAVHDDVFSAIKESEVADTPPRRLLEAETYLQSLCESHLPAVNELIQRYRLATYDYFAYEVSSWDVPVWTADGPQGGATIRLLPYWDWDYKPLIGGPKQAGGPDIPPRPFSFTDSRTLLKTVPANATPGELELLDARSFMERGDFSGAVRRTATALEAAIEWALGKALGDQYDEAEVERRLRASRNDFPGRLRQWLGLSGAQVSQALLDELEVTRSLRHDIVHRGRRITSVERGLAQRCVDTGRWLFNFIEQNPERRDLRERHDTLRAAGRSALAPRFPVALTNDGARVISLDTEDNEPDR